MDPQRIATAIVPRIREKRGEKRPSVYLSIPSVTSEFDWQGGHLETLIEKFLDHVLAISCPARSVRIAVRKKKQLNDLGDFFSISPSYWLDLSIECYAESGLEDGAKRMLESFGYRCLEWAGVEGSESRLGAFHFGNKKMPALVLFMRNRGARRNCDILIPVIESAPCFAHAI
jgi:hypothetical protein